MSLPWSSATGCLTCLSPSQRPPLGRCFSPLLLASVSSAIGAHRETVHAIPPSRCWASDCPFPHLQPRLPERFAKTCRVRRSNLDHSRRGQKQALSLEHELTGSAGVLGRWTRLEEPSPRCNEIGLRESRRAHQGNGKKAVLASGVIDEADVRSAGGKPGDRRRPSRARSLCCGRMPGDRRRAARKSRLPPSWSRFRASRRWLWRSSLSEP
jgi:hypothetical protein